MSWTLVGYFCKRILARSAWHSPYPDHPEAAFPAPPPVEEIGSVSNCIARPPEGAEGNAISNAFGGYQSPDAARRTVPLEQRAEFDCYAYRIASELYRDGDVEPLALPLADCVAVPADFVCIGYDVVELIHAHCLGCSPLSCNGQASQFAVNRYCLVESAAGARQLAREFSRSKPEPGPYCVVEVWRAPRGREASNG